MPGVRTSSCIGSLEPSCFGNVLLVRPGKRALRWHLRPKSCGQSLSQVSEVPKAELVCLALL